MLDNFNCGLAEIANKSLKSEPGMKCSAGINPVPAKMIICGTQHHSSLAEELFKSERS